MNLEVYFHGVASRVLTVLLPEVLIVAVATAMMTAGAFVQIPRRVWAACAAVTLVAATILLYMFWQHPTDAFAAPVLNDAFSHYGRLGFLVTGLILLAMAHDQVDDSRAAEFFGALLLIIAGSMFVAASNELVLLFVGLELVSIPTYLLLYLPRRTVITQEAATKYFYLSIFSSGLLLFGLAYLYGLTGVTNLKALSYLMAHDGYTVVPQGFALVALVFMMAGLGFRVAAVPFHFYAPDVYQGSPTVLAALLAWIPKAIGFLAMLRALTAVFGGAGPLGERAMALAWLLAVITMTLGNTVALWQDNLKRLLAYSSIAHAGYLLIGVAVAFHNVPGTIGPYLGAQGIFFYLAAYALMTLGAFGVILALDRPERPVETVEDLAGVGWSNPLFGLAMALCLFSLAGVPPLAGFWGKFQLFAAALAVGDEHARMFQVLAVIGVLNAAAGAYYYLRIVVVMYLRPAVTPQPARVRVPVPTVLAVAACAILSLVFGCVPEPLNIAALQAAQDAVRNDYTSPAPTAPVATALRAH